mgnify:FL=1
MRTTGDHENGTGKLAYSLTHGTRNRTTPNTPPSESLTMDLTTKQLIISWIARIVVALILFQTLFFKFTGAEESVYIFRTLGLEPWGRIGSGVAELVACVLLLVPRTVVLGALLSAGVISGAIMSHLTKLGIVVKDDGGFLFILTIVVLLGSLLILFIHREEIPVIGPRLAPQRT